MKKSNQITFFGSGPVAAKSLELLLAHTTVDLVVTKPSTEKMMKLASKNIEVITVSNKSELDQLVEDKKMPSTLGILIDFGIIISEKTINYFSSGIINSHFSLLPQWRGADPITFAILSGQKRTGVSLMQLSAGMDTGPIISQATYDITPSDNGITLTDSLIELSDALLKECLEEYLAGTLILQAQETSAALMGIDPTPTYSRKLTKEDGHVHWTKPAEIIEREVRAYISWPKSLAKIGGMDVILREAKVLKQRGEPGSFTATKNSLVVFCGEDSLEIITLQPLGKKEMPIKAFLAGYSSRLIG